MEPVQRVLEFDHFFCDRCREYVYDEARGEAMMGIAPGTHVDDLPDDWLCPRCGGRKEQLRACTLVDDYLRPLKESPTTASCGGSLTVDSSGK